MEVANICLISRHYIDSSAFHGCTGLKEVVLSNKLTTLPEGIFEDCNNLETVVLPEKLVSIPENAFRNTKLTELNLPESVTEIGQYAFMGCNNLKQINLTDNITKLGDHVFASCANLSEVKFGAGITQIPSYAFDHCQALNNVILPYWTTEIGAYAFASCPSLTNIMIPRQTTMIDADAFYSSNNVTIRGISGSYAEEYAAAHSIPFESIDIPAAQIAITPENPTVNRGRTVQLVLTVTPEDFTDEVQWKTADTDIVTVDERGVVTGIAAGTATVRVTVGNLTKDITVTVNEPISRIYLNQTSAELKAGEVLTLTTTVYPENATNKNMLWTSSNPAVAQVDENGRVLAISKGTATIQAEAADGSGCTASCTVTVTGNLNMVTSVEHFESSHPYQNNLSEVWLYQSPGAERITLTFSDDTEFEAPYDYLEIYANQNQLVGKYTGKELAGQKIVVSGESVLVRLVTDKGGSAYGFRVVDITAEKGDEKPDSALTAIRLNRSSLQLKTDETSKLEVIYEPADTNEDKSVVWDSSNTDIVTVDNTGFITAVSIGTADITVTSVLKPELKDSCTITVSDDDIAEETCTVTFETSGGSSVEPVICRKGSRLSDFGIAVPTKENHIFDGWYKDSECTILWDMNTDTVTSDMTLYAKWTEQNDNNNDNDNMDDDDSAYEMAQRIKLNSVGGQIAAVKSKVYDGSVYRPNIKVTVKENGRTIILTEGADYRVLYDDRINVGAGTITVKGNGKYTGVLTTQYQITPKSLKKLKIVTGDIAADADREIQLEKLPVYVSDAETDSALIYGQDYVLEVVRGNITRKGKLEVNIKAKEGSNYDNIKSVKVKITVYDASGKNFKGIINPENVCYVNEKDKSQIYTGNAIKPEFSVKVGESTLVKNKDFSVKYMNNKEAGVAYAVITGKKGYVGSVVKEFEITPAKSILRLKREIKAVTYNGKLQKPKVSVMAGSKTLKAGRDYTVSYSKNLHASKVRNQKEAVVTITGKGNYRGVKSSFNFEIKPQNIKKVSVKGTSKVLNLTYAKHALLKDHDYTIGETVNAGKKVNITIIGHGDFQGSVVKKVKE